MNPIVYTVMFGILEEKGTLCTLVVVLELKEQVLLYMSL